MSLSVSLFSALSGLQTNQAALQVISENVTNANTVGYTRKVALPETVTLAGSAAGVELGDIARNVDPYLVADSNDALSQLAAIDVQSNYYQRIQDLYGQPDSNTSVSARIGNLGAALLELAATPESPALQIDAVNKAVTLAQQLNDMADQIQALRTQADQDIATKLHSVNEKLEAVAELNADIASRLAVGQSAADLEDQRDQAVQALSELIGVKTFTRESGVMVVMTPDGRVLADSVAATLSHDAAAQLDASIGYPGGINGIPMGGADITGSLAGGEVGGLIELRDSLLPGMQDELDRLAQVLRDELNQAYNLGSALPPANTVTGTRSFAAPGADSVSFTADVRIGVVDPAGDFVAYYDLPAGAYTVSAIEGLIDANLAGFASASTAAGGPLSISADDPANGIAIVDLGANSVTHTDGATVYQGFSHYFGLNDLFVTPGASPGDPAAGIANTIAVRSDIVADQDLLVRGTLDSGTGAAAPAIGSAAIAAGDNGAVQALADAFGRSVTFAAAGNLAATSTTLAGYGADIVSANSIKASQHASSVEFRRTVYDQLAYRLQSESGVNVDEELANMIVYQNAYAATAQVITTTEELFEILNGMLR